MHTQKLTYKHPGEHIHTQYIKILRHLFIGMLKYTQKQTSIHPFGPTQTQTHEYSVTDTGTITHPDTHEHITFRWTELRETRRIK